MAGLYLALGHGLGKISSLLAQGGNAGIVKGVSQLGFPAPLVFAWLAALSEFAGGLCVALGLFTPIAAAFAAFTMAVASFGRHHALQQLLGFLGVRGVSEEQARAWGNPELSFVYLLAMVTVALAGPGALSLDRLLGRKK
jgi:putative oxidoreductase